MRRYQKQFGVKDGLAVHPFVRWMWGQINLQKRSQQEVAKTSGVPVYTMCRWRRGARSPSLSDMEAVVNTLGYDLRLTVKEK